MLAFLITFYLRCTALIIFTFFLSLILLIIPTTYNSVLIILSQSLALIKDLILYSLVGLSFSILASLSAWPFALTFSTLILHKKDRPVFKFVQNVSYLLSTIPLLVFSYVIIEVLGKNSLFGLNNFTFDILSTSNLITQTLAFALTLLLYPLTILPFFYGQTSVDLFFQEMLNAVIKFAELGFISFVIIFSLFLYILPRMIVKMFYYLQKDQNIKNYEIIQSLGGTQWESLYITSLHAMKSNFSILILHFTKVCFFEGLITFSLINYYLINYQNNWGQTLGSLYVEEALNNLNLDNLLLISGFLILIFSVFLIVEIYISKKRLNV
jgi:hypothetical protein